MTSLTLVRLIAARPAVVFDVLVTPEGLGEWIGPDAGPVLVAQSDARVGGAFRLRFRMLDGSEHESVGEYLIVEPPHRLAMTWRWIGHPDDTGVSRIDIELRSISTGTELTFTHSQLRDEAIRKSHEAGWSGSLAKLVAHFEQR